MKNSTKIIVAAGIAMTLSVGTVAASAHDGSTGNKDADMRIMKMKELGGGMKAIAGFAKGQAEFSPALETHAKRIVEISKEMKTLFPEGSGGPKTRSKDEIWAQPDAFGKAADNFEAAAAKLMTAVMTKDQATIGAALGATGKTCGGCHKPFRTPKH